MSVFFGTKMFLMIIMSMHILITVAVLLLICPVLCTDTALYSQLTLSYIFPPGQCL